MAPSRKMVDPVLPSQGRITALKFQKGNADRVNLFIEGQFAFSIPAIEAARLKVGQFLEETDIQRLSQLGEESRVRDRAVRFLSFRPRSEAEMRCYLAGKGIEADQIDRVITWLREMHYLDDRAFALWWVDNRCSFSPRGIYALRAELRGKGISETILNEVLSEVADRSEEMLESLARSRARRLSVENEASFKRKLSEFLMRRGFAWEDVASVVSRLWEERASSPSDGII